MCCGPPYLFIKCFFLFVFIFPYHKTQDNYLIGRLLAKKLIILSGGKQLASPRDVVRLEGTGKEFNIQRPLFHRFSL